MREIRSHLFLRVHLVKICQFQMNIWGTQDQHPSSQDSPGRDLVKQDRRLWGSDSLGGEIESREPFGSGDLYHCDL